jgi:hypothetical protein
MAQYEWSSSAVALDGLADELNRMERGGWEIFTIVPAGTIDVENRMISRTAPGVAVVARRPGERGR